MNPDIRVVEKEYTFPFTPHAYQYESIEEGAAKIGALFRGKVGSGKSIMSIYLGLYHSIANGVEQILILAPPVLLDQWAEFLDQIKGLPGYLMYRGTPGQRKAMDLSSEPVVLMSFNIFRSDFKQVESQMAKKRRLFILADELSLKSASNTYKLFKTLVYGKLRIHPFEDKPKHYFCALNATPVSDRKQIYWWSAIFDPSIYPSLRYFETQHAGATDHWGKILAWRKEEVMDQNFDSFSVLPKEVGYQLPDSVYTKLPYTLEPAHRKLYNKIADGLMADLPDDITELAVDALFATLQRVVVCPSEFGLTMQSPVIDIIDQYLDQMDEDDKLIVYTRHVMVSKLLHEKYPQSVAVFGSIGNSKKKANIKAFKAGEAEMMVANLDSLSKGQNLQVANHTLFAELPFRSDVMTQACGRTARQGQQKTCFFHIPYAKGTIQERIYKRLLDNDMDLKNFNRNKKTLAEFLFDK